MKRRHNSIGLIIFLVIVIAIPNGIAKKPVQVSAARTGTVTATSLNVRSEPSITSDKVRLNGTDVYLTKGETVNILDEEGEFYYVSLKFNGKIVKGYIHRDFVAAEALPTATPKPTVTPKPTKMPNGGETDSITKKVELEAVVTAKSLNVRSGPGTGYSKAGGLLKGDKVTVINEALTEDEEWYAITFRSEGKTQKGYVLSAYIKLSFDSSIKGEAAVSKLKLRAKASSKAAYLKDKSGNIISLKKGKNVTILKETTVSGSKWLKVSCTISDNKYTGYALSSQISFRTTVNPTATPTATPTPTPKPTAIPTPTSAPTVTSQPAKTPTPTISITPKATMEPTPAALPEVTKAPTPTPTNAPAYLQLDNNPTVSSVRQPKNGFVCNTDELYIVYDLVYFTNILDNKGNPVTLKNSQQVLVTDVTTVDRVAWYKVSLDSGIYGYVMGTYIYIGDTLPSETGTMPSVPAPSVTVTPTPTPVVTDNMDFEAKLEAEGFPESYKDRLRMLHVQYPNWEFKAYQTGLDWSTVLEAECVPGKNLLPNSKSVEWKSFESGAYNWKTDTFIVFDGSTWVTASDAAVAYYMDPRNFLTANGIFQFELLKYQSTYQNLSGIENILKGTAMYNSYYNYTDDSGEQQSISYAQTFIKAAEYSGVSPYHLASRVKQEVVTGPTTLSGSVSGTYSGYEGLYNFYNIGANDSAGGGAIANGLRFARNGSTNATSNLLYMIPWTSPFRSIVGGSYFIGGSYINRGQDTVYLQKFNVTPISTYYHQYMTNVEAPYAEAKKILTAYNGMVDSPIVFMIPVYQNMPGTASPMPTTMFNPNNRMKSLKITDAEGNSLAISPTFSQTEYEYYLIVDNAVNTVRIKATTVSKKATIIGGGTIDLNAGTNTVVVSVIAENGTIQDYTINVVRQE